MTMPSWPISNYYPIQDSFQPLQRMRDPIETDMEGGNSRSRPRPGDNVGMIGQTIWMSNVDYDTFTAWVKTTLNNGTARFTMNVWLGNAYVNKVCKFLKPGTGIKSSWLSVNEVAVSMSLMVFDV